MLKKHLQQVYALFNILLMLFQTVAPAAFLVTPAYAATEVQEVAVSGVALAFDKDTNEFSLSGTATEAVEYVVSYRGPDSDLPEEAVMGTAEVSDGTFSETIYAGTCSGEDCVADEVVSGTVVLSNANYKAEYEITDGVLWLRSGAVATVAQVELGHTYVAPQNDDVTVTFTKLPENPGTLSIEEITLSDEQVAELGALSNVAYDITSSMEDGTFEYELTLPRPEGSDETLEIKHAESVEELASAETVETIEVTDKVTAKGLDHFTVFVVASSIPVANGDACTVASISGTCYDDLQAAVDAASDGDTIELAGDITVTQRVNIYRDITLDGNGNTIYSDFAWTSNSNNAALEVSHDGITIEDVTIDGTSSTSLHGINTYNALNVYLDGVVLINNGRSGLVVNGSTVTVNNISTSGNGWHGINVDQGGNVTNQSKLVINGYSSQTDGTHILVDDITEDVLVEDTMGQYTFVDYGNTRIYTLVDLPPATPTGLTIFDHNGVELGCSGATNNRSILVDWDDNSEADLAYYQYDIKDKNDHERPPVSEYSNTIRDLDGDYKFRVRAVDTAGNKSEPTEWCEVTLDRTAPGAPTIEFPNEGDAFNTTPILNDWNDVNDASGIMKYRVQYEYDDGHKFSGYPYRETTASQRNHVPNTSEEGGVKFRVQAFDNAGNEGAWSEWRHYYYDITAPTISWTEPLDGSVHSGPVTLGASANEVLKNLRFKWHLPGEAWDPGQNLNVSDTAYSWVFNPGVDGIYTLRAQGRDLALNWAQAEDIEITIDATSPTGTIDTPADGSATNGSSLEVTGTVADNLSGIDKVEVRLRNYPGNTYRTPWQTATVESDGSYSATIDISSIPDDDYEVAVVAYDNAGNSKWLWKRPVVTIDRVNPSSVITTFDLPDGGEKETPTFDGLIEGTATDENSGVAEVNLEIMYTPFGSTDSMYWNGTAWQTDATMVTATGTDTWSYQILEAFVAEGIYDVTSHATDNAGNVETTYTIKIVYDKTIPEVVLTIDPTTPDGNNGWYKLYEPRITLTASDNYDVDYIEYQWNTTTDGNWTTYTGPIKPPSQGQNILYYRAVDLVGNVSSRGVKDVRYDSTDPADYPLNVRVENITADDADGVWERPKDDSDVTRYVLEWKHQDGTVRGATVGRDTFKHKLDQLKDGVWEFSVKAMDDAGNFKESKVSFRVGPEPSTGTETVLGVTDTIEGDGIGGAILGARSNGSSQEDEKATDEGSEKSGSEEAAEEGEVLGATSCSAWKYYLPLILLALQLLSILAFEFFRRTPGLLKLGVVAAITVGVVAVFYFFKDAGCYVDGSWLAMITQWFPGLSLATAVVTKLLAYGFIEEA